MAGSVWLITRAQARRRWRALVGLTLFVGVVGGLSLSLIAGSQRSASVVDRYLATARQYDLELYSASLTREDVLSIPGVERADPEAYVAMTTTQPNGEEAGVNGIALDFRALDPTYRVLEGAIPDGSDPNEVLVNQFFVEQFGRSVGDRIKVRMFGREQADEVSGGVYESRGPSYLLRIAGIVRPAQDVAVDKVEGLRASVDDNAVALSNAFYETHQEEFLDFGEAYSVRLRDGRRGRDAFLAAVTALVPAGEDPPLIGPVGINTRRDSLDTPVQLETSALLVLGIGLAFAGTIATALVLRAEQRALDNETPTLRTLGSTAPQFGISAVVRTTPVALGGGLLALGIAVALSGRYPIGIGRQLELDGGTDVNLAVLGLGALLIVGFIAGLSFVLGRPRPVRTALPTQRRTLARWLAAVGAPTGLALGAQLAFERGRGIRSVPSRAAIVGGAAALAIVTAVAIYVSGIDHVYSERNAHGWSWDAAIGNTNFPLAPSTAEKLADDARVAHQTRARYGDATVNGRSAEFLAIDSDGDAPPEIISGRLPETASEVALGPGTLEALGVEVGATVTFSVADGEFDEGGRTKPREMRVVGTSLPPIFGESDLGSVGIVTFDGIEAAGGGASPRYVLARLRDGGARADLLALRESYTEEIATNIVPARIVNLHRVRRLPLIGLLLAGLMGTIALLYTLAVSARARAQELAVLRALGLPSRRLRGVLAWQGSVLAAGMLVIGIPIGLIMGGAAWNAVADDLGVRGGVVATPLIFLLGPLALLVAVCASIPPARRASRAPVASQLRVE